MKKVFTLFSLFTVCMSVWADGSQSDFVEGGIAYTKLTDKTVAVVQYGTETDEDFVSNYKGAITIPATVTNGGVTYSVTEIGEEAFSKSEITSIILPESLVRIGEQAFERTALTTITLPKNVKYLGNESYWDEWDGNKEWIEEDELYGDVFNRCSSLTEVKVDPANETYTDIDGVLYTKDQKTLLYFPIGKKNAVIANGTEVIYNEAFAGAPFTTITLPNTLKSIGRFAFEGSALTSITIPASVTEIGEGAFEECEDLTDVYNLATTPQTIEDPHTFPIKEEWTEDGPVITIEMTLHVPAGSKTAYETADVWKFFTTIIEDTTTSISSAMHQANGETETYTLDGIRTNGQHKGLNIIRQTDGTVKKVFVK